MCKIGYKYPKDAVLTCLEGTKFSGTSEIKCSTAGKVELTMSSTANTKLNSNNSIVIERLDNKLNF